MTTEAKFKRGDIVTIEWNLATHHEIIGHFGRIRFGSDPLKILYETAPGHTSLHRYVVQDARGTVERVDEEVMRLIERT